MTFLNGTLVAVYVPPLKPLPKFIARSPDRLGLTDATSNVAVFPTTDGCTTLWFCCDLDAFIAVIVTDLPVNMTIDVTAIKNISGRMLSLLRKLQAVV